VAERFNELAAREGTDPEGRAGMSSSHLCELERWPDSDRKPSVYVLCLLAKVYETDVLCLLDLADHESLPQHDRLVLMRRQRAETPFGDRVLVLAEERGLSLRELARRVPCDASHLSKVVHGRKRPSPRVAARLDDAPAGAGIADLRSLGRRNPGQGPVQQVLADDVAIRGPGPRLRAVHQRRQHPGKQGEQPLVIDLPGRQGIVKRPVAARNSGSRDSCTSDRTGRFEHSTSSARSNSASPIAVRHPCSRRRNSVSAARSVSPGKL
jgi:transcriptional regulator with XRE-family HTH domain